MEKMTKAQADRLIACPECDGHGEFETPSKVRLARRATCARCNGLGYIESFEKQKEKPNGNESD